MPNNIHPLSVETPQPIQAIFLVIKQNDSMGKKEWRCMNCGKKIFVTKNKTIYTIFEGEVISLETSFQLQCWNCKTIYLLDL